VIRAARFLGGYLRQERARVREVEVSIPMPQGGEVEGTFYLPRGARRAPGWVVLHGVTVPGRRHESLLRFSRAMAASGAAVLVPDVPAWRELRVRSETARVALLGATAYLRERPEVQPGGLGVVGFSFGATHALIASTHPGLRDVVRTVVGFGGYCDLRREVRCMFTGEHEWEGRAFRLDPDPYGRWILAGNYLTGVPGMEGMGRVADEARELAAEAGRRRTFAGEADYDPLKAAARARLSPEEHGVWDLLAPPFGTPIADLDRARDLADGLTTAALAADPGLDPRHALPELHARVVLAHGEADRLIPFTESLRMHAALPERLDRSVTITRLFAHSTGSAAVRAVEYGVEGLRFFQLLRRALR
jgi:pimeloyl-ACP methyl ester carboxylesterase